MIVELFLTPLFSLVIKLTEFIPDALTNFGAVVGAIGLLTKGLYFFPPDLWSLVIGNITFWLTVNFTWVIVEWVYKKLPGVS